MILDGTKTAEEHFRDLIGQEGAPTKRTAGGWIADLAALRKAIVLCEACKPKWNPKAYGYVERKLPGTHHFVSGACDGCGQLVPRATLHMPEDQDGLFRHS